MPYDLKYESQLLRGVEEPRPWDLLEIIKKHTIKSGNLLDIGCGTAFKLINLANSAYKIYGLEPNNSMLNRAIENIRNSSCPNIFLMSGKAEEIPFNDNSFDIVVCMVAPHDTSEVYRVLKPNRYAILEKIGDRDKWNFKEVFGSDELGNRGQFSNFSGGELASNYEKEFKVLFTEISVQNSFWKTYYSLEGLLLLLDQTPTIRNFGKIKDHSAIERIQEKYSTSKGLETTQNRILIVAKK